MVVCPFTHNVSATRLNPRIRVWTKSGDGWDEVAAPLRARFWACYMQLRKQYPGQRLEVYYP